MKKNFPTIQSRNSTTENESLFIYGRHPVEEALVQSPKKVSKIFIKKGNEVGFNSMIEKTASSHKIPVVLVDKKKIFELVGDVNDQGVVAVMSAVEFVELKDWIESVKDIKNPCCLLLDELEDAGNVGAIIRSATAFGIHGIIIGKHRQSPISGTTYKTSAGTLGKIPLIRVNNLNNALDVFKDNRFWVLGLDADGDTELSKVDMDMPMCIVIGAEGDGVRMKTLERCDFKVTIPMENGVESLNASVTAALVMYQWTLSRT